MNTLTGCYCRHKPKTATHNNMHQPEEWGCSLENTNILPLSEGDGGSRSSRSSAEDMVPVEGVLGSRRLKSPENIYMKAMNSNIIMLST